MYFDRAQGPWGEPHGYHLPPLSRLNGEQQVPSTNGSRGGEGENTNLDPFFSIEENKSISSDTHYNTKLLSPQPEAERFNSPLAQKMPA